MCIRDRDNYMKSLKKTVPKSGQKAKCIKPYKYSELLSFLKKYLKERETRINIEGEVTGQNVTDEEGTSILLHEDVENTQMDTAQLNSAVTEESQSHRSSSSKEIQCPIQRKKPKLPTPPPTAASTLMQYLLQKTKRMPLQSPHKTPLTLS